MRFLAKALGVLRPGEPMYYNSGEPIDASKIVYESECEPITQQELDTKIAELQAAYDALAYARKREAEYPSIQELVVALYDTDDKSAIEAKRAAVKAKYPKG